ncbi:hypothetical protein U9M48_014705 [Paspalum notatum var. saurae]|uniref:DDE Tnp4 domain-containing protein n=1 Tax=Paspalum notatum var. saurae TaxID=547442 RepID=A0AAQ3T235_PASNO
MMPFADDVLRPTDSSYAELPEELAEYSPLFDGCIGAIDGTLIEVSVPERFQADFTNRHGWRSQNVICVCNFKMMFTYVGVGTEGSAHDMRVYRQKALMDRRFPRPPKGRYYLADSGYSCQDGIMPPHPGMRYHVKEFKKKAPQNIHELFNQHHSRLRNVIERCFGAAKSKWPMLDRVPHYPLLKQSEPILAGFALWNFVHALEGPRHPLRRRLRGGLSGLRQLASMALGPDASTEEVREWITLGLGLLGNNYWNDQDFDE